MDKAVSRKATQRGQDETMNNTNKTPIFRSLSRMPRDDAFARAGYRIEVVVVLVQRTVRFKKKASKFLSCRPSLNQRHECPSRCTH